MTEEKKKIDEMSDEEFDKLSEEGGIDLQPKEEDEDASKPEKAEEPQEDEEEKEEKEEDIEDEKDEEGGDPLRTPHIPYSKHAKEKQKWTEVKENLEEEVSGMKKTIEDLQGKLSESGDASDMNKDIEEFAEKSGLDKDVVSGLANIIKKHSGVDEKVAKKIEEFESLQDELHQEKMFEDEYKEKALPGFESINPKATKAQMTKAKEKLSELALDERYINVPMDMIVSHFKDDFTEILGEKVKKKTLEGTSPGKVIDDEIPDEELAPEDWQNMTDEEFDKRSERLAEKSPSQMKITRRGEQIN